MHKIYETLFSLTRRIVGFYTRDFRVLISEKYEPRIQLKESENPLTVEIRNPISTDMESGIQYFTAWNPAELRDYHPPMKVPYIGGEKKWNSLIVESLPGFRYCSRAFGTDLI